MTDHRIETSADRRRAAVDERRMADQSDRERNPDAWERVPELAELDAIFGASWRRKSQEV